MLMGSLALWNAFESTLQWFVVASGAGHGHRNCLAIQNARKPLVVVLVPGKHQVG